MLEGPILQGRIEFKNVKMSYRADLEPALRDLSFVVEAGDHVAVVGRTGAGKSSLF
jgi:ABC-type bacteriocin/lantibiotic exporter with double-glycine peptidase domain